jgi:hypothetical protein
VRVGVDDGMVEALAHGMHARTLASRA